MSLQNEIYNDYRDSYKSKEKEFEKNTLNILLGEFARERDKSLPDDKVIGIIEKLIKYDIELGNGNSEYIQVLKKYIPNKMDENQIKMWLEENVDFSKLKNKMQAIGIIKKEFKAGVIDGDLVKEILNKYF